MAWTIDPNFCSQMLWNKGGRRGEGLICRALTHSKGLQGLQAGLHAQTYDMFVRVHANTNRWYVCSLVCVCMRHHPPHLSSSWHHHLCHDCFVAVNAQVSLLLLWWQLSLSSWWRCCHCWCAGITAIVELALLPSLLVIKQASLPSSWWHHCHQCAGIFTIIAITIIVLMAMASLPLSMHRCPCCHQAGVVALVTMASSPLICIGVVALVVMALLPSLSWCSCPCCNGVIIITSVIVLIACHQAGIVALVVMALLPLMHRRLCCCCNGDCCSCHDGIVAIVNEQASPPLSS